MIPTRRLPQERRKSLEQISGHGRGDCLHSSPVGRPRVVNLSAVWKFALFEVAVELARDLIWAGQGHRR